MSIMEDVLNIAKGEVGYLEKASRAYLYDKTANAGYNNYTKYWEDIAPGYQGQPWCAGFITWTIVKRVGVDNAKKLLKHYPYVYCPAMKSLFTLNSNPKVGDIVIFYRNGEFAHTGWVIEVNGDWFATIEGNTSNGNGIIANGGGVCKKSYYNSNLPGTKFVTLDWDSIQEEPDWDEWTVDLVGTITASQLNVRSKPNTYSTILAEHKNGDIVDIIAETDNGWYKVNYPFGEGYISGDYVTTMLRDNESLTQEEFNELMNNWLAALAKEEPSTWSADPRAYVQILKIFNGDTDGSMRYHSYLNREELAQILFNLHKEVII